MSLSNLTTKQLYNGTGSLTTFAIPFDYVSASEVRVILRDASGGETVQTSPTHYSIVGSDIEMVTAPGATEKLLVKRLNPLNQLQAYSETGPFPAESHEEALDKLARQAQELSERIDRALLQQESDNLGQLNLPQPLAGSAIGWNAAADGLENKSDLGGVTISAFGATLIDDANASAARTTLGIDGSSGNIVRGDLADGAVAKKNVVYVDNAASPYSVATTDDVYYCDASSGAITLNLPTASGITGYEVTIKKTDSSANAVTIDGSGSETIDDSLTAVLNVQYDSITIASDGSNWSVVSISKKPVINYYTSGTTWNKPAGIKYVKATVVGAGSGGGGVDGQGSGTWVAGGGGGAGGAAIATVLASSLGSTETVTVGAGGAGGAAGNNNGTAGTSSSFGAHAAANPGGVGSGGTGTTSFISRSGGTGGAGTAGDFLLQGGCGNPGIAGGAGSSGGYGGNGGDSYLAGGANGVNGDNNGNDASSVAYGAGGSGAFTGNITTNYAGGDGADGIVIVEEHY